MRIEYSKLITRLKSVRWTRWAAGALALVATYALGVSVGNGNVQLHFYLLTKHSENAGLPSQLDYSSVTQLYQVLKANYDGKLTPGQLVDGLKTGLAEATNDPYTEYFTPKEAKDFENQLNNSFSGIGAALGKNSDGDLIIVSPIKGFPAEKAGLLPQDVIASINGDSTSGMGIEAAANKIRGPKGTQVTLKIIRNKSDTLTFTVTRDDIQLPSVTSKVLDGNIGYLQISSFSNDTSRLATDAAKSFKDAHVKGVILDLRGNPGGLLDAAVDVSSLWLPMGKTVVTEKGTSGDQSYTSNGSAYLQGIPTIVLINSGSASASEITAGALHDNNVARLIGEKSFGKGVVQQIVNFNDGSELKVTIASWYRPNGQNINKKGIDPDQVVALSDQDAKNGTDPQLAAAQAYLNQ